MTKPATKKQTPVNRSPRLDVDPFHVMFLGSSTRTTEILRKFFRPDGRRRIQGKARWGFRNGYWFPDIVVFSDEGATAEHATEAFSRYRRSVDYVAAEALLWHLEVERPTWTDENRTAVFHHSTRHIENPAYWALRKMQGLGADEKFRLPNSKTVVPHHERTGWGMEPGNFKGRNPESPLKKEGFKAGTRGHRGTQRKVLNDFAFDRGVQEPAVHLKWLLERNAGRDWPEAKADWSAALTRLKRNPKLWPHSLDWAWAPNVS